MWTVRDCLFNILAATPHIWKFPPSATSGHARRSAKRGIPLELRSKNPKSWQDFCSEYETPNRATSADLSPRNCNNWSRTSNASERHNTTAAAVTLVLLFHPLFNEMPTLFFFPTFVRGFFFSLSLHPSFILYISCPFLPHLLLSCLIFSLRPFLCLPLSIFFSCLVSLPPLLPDTDWHLCRSRPSLAHVCESPVITP